MGRAMLQEWEAWFGKKGSLGGVHAGAWLRRAGCPGRGVVPLARYLLLSPVRGLRGRCLWRGVGFASRRRREGTHVCDASPTCVLARTGGDACRYSSYDTSNQRFRESDSGRRPEESGNGPGCDGRADVLAETGGGYADRPPGAQRNRRPSPEFLARVSASGWYVPGV